MILRECELIGPTPGGGCQYYDRVNDRAIVVYNAKTRIFSQRKLGAVGKSPCRFECEETIPEALTLRDRIPERKVTRRIDGDGAETGWDGGEKCRI